jgi:hypothetical protein
MESRLIDANSLRLFENCDLAWTADLRVCLEV